MTTPVKIDLYLESETASAICFCQEYLFVLLSFFFFKEEDKKQISISTLEPPSPMVLQARTLQN